MRIGFNIALDHRPELIVDAAGPDDVIAAVTEAARAGRPVAVLNTGHGPSVPADGATLIRTGRMNQVSVDPDRRVARVAGGAVWLDVITAAFPYGLAPLNGSSPAVGRSATPLAAASDTWRDGTASRPITSGRSSWSPPTEPGVE